MNQAAPPKVPVVVRETTFFLFLLSGASGLLFETLWTYQATLALGSSSWAITAVLSAFMAGLALGNLLALRRSVWTLRFYAALEAIILVTGLAALVLLPALGRLLAPLFAGLAEQPALVNLLRFGISFAVLAVPSTAMGMTLPALAQALGGERGSFRSVLGQLYGFNTIGALGGVLLGEMLLLPRAGVFGTAAVAALMNGTAAVGGWILARRGGVAPSSPEPAWDRSIPRGLTPAFVSVFLAGFSLLALEVVWMRFLALFVPNNSLAFALMLAMVLSGIALGGLVGSSPYLGRRNAFLFLFAAGVALVASYGGFSAFHRPPGINYWDTLDALRISFALQFPVSLLSGTFFTLAGTEVRNRISSSQASAGLLIFFNTLGAAAGAILGGLLLLPGLGVERSFFALAVVYGVAALVWYRAGGGSRRALALGAAAWLAALLLFPFGHFRREHLPATVRLWEQLPDTRIQAVHEGRMETIIYLQAREFGQPLYSRMLTNSFSMSADMALADRYMRQFVYWPVAVHPAPRRALLICFGVGSTAQALVRTRELEHIDVVDISRDILELSTVVLPDPATHPLKDPRVKVHLEDGRFFLQTRKETWDIITGEPPPPENQGVAGLYSREYFRLLKDRLSEGGIATYWLPLVNISEPAARSIVRAWSDTFETCFLWRGADVNLMLVGLRGPARSVEERRFAAQWENPETLRDLIGVGLELPESLGTGFVGDADYLRAISAGAEPTEDAYPKRILVAGSNRQTMYPDWFSLEACAGRFRGSRSISEIWPRELRERTLASFKQEELIATLSQSTAPDFREIHRLCTTTRLKTPLLQILKSDRDYVRAAERSDPAAKAQPLAQFHLGAAALAERDYGRASDHFLRTVGVPGMRRNDLTICIYVLCMAGRREEAERILEANWAEAGPKKIDAHHWTWMKETFGLKIPQK